MRFGRMTSFFPSLNPTPAFPKHYGGPYPVGTVDIEIPVSELPSVARTPDPSITTVSFRIFYPCESPHSSPKPVYWIPDPQHGYVSAYARFLGASSRISQLIAWVRSHAAMSPLIYEIDISHDSSITSRYPPFVTQRFLKRLVNQSDGQ